MASKVGMHPTVLRYDALMGPHANADDQLAALKELHDLFGERAIESWLFGGWAVDFHAGAITRPHDDIDMAVWRVDLEPLAKLLADAGFRRVVDEHADGYVRYERAEVALELAFLERGEDGAIYTPLREGRASWPEGAFADDVLELRGVRARVVGLRALRADKSEVRDDATTAGKDVADLRTLSRLGS
jgi:hypothetical protein